MQQFSDDKGKGIELVCSYFDADLQDTIALGDSMHDYEMMQTAGISFRHCFSILPSSHA